MILYFFKKQTFVKENERTALIDYDDEMTYVELLGDSTGKKYVFKRDSKIYKGSE